MEGHFTWFDLLPEQLHFGMEHEAFAAAAGSVTATGLIVVMSVLGHIALGKGEAAIRPAERLSLKGFFEAFTEFMNGVVDMVLGEHGRSLLPVFAAIFFYIAFNNLMGLIPGFPAATANINAALALGVFSFVLYNVIGFKHAGVHYLKHFMGPVWWMAWILIPIELISNFVRPFSLGIRLSVNMTADHTILGTFIELTKVGVPVIFYGMGTFVSLLQAFVFTMLSMVYVMMATADDH